MDHVKEDIMYLNNVLDSGRPRTRRDDHRPTVCENLQEELEKAWDDVSGAELDAAKVRKARKEEV